MVHRETKPRWRRRKDARPAEIVQAALEAFSERGFAATRLDDVATRAGVSKGTLYLYFDSKEELFKAVVRQEMLPNLAIAEQALAGSTATTEELLRLLVTRMTGVVAGGRLAAIPKLIIAEAGNFPDLARFYIDEVVSRGFRMMQAILARGIARGEVRDIDLATAPPVVAGPFLLIAVWKSVLEPHAPMKIDPAQFIETYLEVVLNGLLKTPKES